MRVQEVQPVLELVDGKRLRKFRNLAMAYIRSNGEDDASQTSFAREIE